MAALIEVLAGHGLDVTQVMGALGVGWVGWTNMAEPPSSHQMEHLPHPPNRR